MTAEPGYWHPSRLAERWSWYRGPWRERDACGAWCTRQAIEDGSSETLCRNGGSFMGPRSKAMRETRSQVMQEWQAAQHARYLAAHDATNGYMVKKGAPAHVRSSAFYPAAPGHRPPFRWASEDLERFWADNPGQRPIAWREFVRDYAAQWQHPLEAVEKSPPRKKSDDGGIAAYNRKMAEGARQKKDEQTARQKEAFSRINGAPGKITRKAMSKEERDLVNYEANYMSTDDERYKRFSTYQDENAQTSRLDVLKARAWKKARETRRKNGWRT